jgi:hypothetical protein
VDNETDKAVILTRACHVGGTSSWTTLRWSDRAEASNPSGRAADLLW